MNDFLHCRFLIKLFALEIFSWIHAGGNARHPATGAAQLAGQPAESSHAAHAVEEGVRIHHAALEATILQS